MIEKILIANRGEIAVRIMRTCREMGIRSVAVYSEADRKAMHVRYADEAYCVGPAPSLDSYLNIDNILKAAQEANADAIHPGYGFLSENALFAQKAAEAGLIFIGPSPEAISLMGDKLTARQLMTDSGVPVVPGSKESMADETMLLKTATEIGFPVMIKASAGGGGKGMRLVKQESELIPAYRRARSESLAAFGDDTVYIEKYLESPHHIEFQILADQHGNTIHLFERECSVQRRHQKVIEETPSPFITPELRKKMGQQAIAAAKTVNYTGAGTIEFLMDKYHNFYFLEMNTRLQVEHPITERVTGKDLVKAQINIANGLELEFKQEELVQKGHAIECRIYAEDHKNNFAPSPGLVKNITEPMGLGLRTDGYVYEGYEIPIYYDPLISKLIVWAPSRQEAIARMKRALYEYKITGIKTSIPFLAKIMDSAAFQQGRYDTHFIEDNLEFLLEEDATHQTYEDIALFIAYLDYTDKLNKYTPEKTADTKSQSNWKTFGHRNNLFHL
ncbi:acetyl-CoA carboxylase biotin carboxylase subunit [Marinilabiliaceae bacterium JC017]|nr:acetyl-CoA carboxylase biotin carboxylase subunit [Marinilabiliaceae bacterium JC017]